MLRIDSKYTYHGSIGESCPWASFTVTGGFLSTPPHSGSDADLEYDEPTTNRPEPIQRSMGGYVIAFSRYDTAFRASQSHGPIGTGLSAVAATLLFVERGLFWKASLRVSSQRPRDPSNQTHFQPSMLCVHLSRVKYITLSPEKPNSCEPEWPRPKRAAVCCGDFRPFADLMSFHAGHGSLLELRPPHADVVALAAENSETAERKTRMGRSIRVRSCFSGLGLGAPPQR